MIQIGIWFFRFFLLLKSKPWPEEFTSLVFLFLSFFLSFFFQKKAADQWTGANAAKNKTLEDAVQSSFRLVLVWVLEVVLWWFSSPLTRPQINTQLSHLCVSLSLSLTHTHTHPQAHGRINIKASTQQRFIMFNRHSVNWVCVSGLGLFPASSFSYWTDFPALLWWL